jgi:hypothetical protein
MCRSEGSLTRKRSCIGLQAPYLATTPISVGAIGVVPIDFIEIVSMELIRFWLSAKPSLTSVGLFALGD